MQVPKTHREVCPAYGVPEIGTIINGTGNFCEHRKRELQRGSGGGGWRGTPPQEIFRSEILKNAIASCVEKVPKYFVIFLNFDKKSVAISCIIFSYLIIIVKSLLILAKHDTNYLRRTKKRCVFLSSVHLLSASIQVAPGKKIGH